MALEGKLSKAAHDAILGLIERGALMSALRVANCQNSLTGELEPVLVVFVPNGKIMQAVPVAKLLDPTADADLYAEPDEADQPVDVAAPAVAAVVEPPHLILPFTVGVKP